MMETLIEVPYSTSVRVVLSLLERNVVPDRVIRRLIRLLLASRLRYGYKPSSDIQLSHLLTFVHSMVWDKGRLSNIICPSTQHMKNYKELLKKISKWMKQDSLLFVHHFCHKAFSYHFEEDVSVVDHGLVNGTHYAITSEEWLKRMDQNMGSIKPIMESTFGKDLAVKWTAYWRTFFISVAELFGYNNGEEWMVTHYLFKKK